MSVEGNEMMFIYNSGEQTDRTALGYAMAVKGYVLKEHDTRKDMFTETQLKEIALKLKVSPAELINKMSDIYRKKYQQAELSEDDALKVIRHEPLIMRTPIVLYHDHGEFVTSKYEFVKRGMATPDVTSKHANKEERSD